MREGRGGGPQSSSVDFRHPFSMALKCEVHGFPQGTSFKMFFLKRRMGGNSAWLAEDHGMQAALRSTASTP